MSTHVSASCFIMRVMEKKLAALLSGGKFVDVPHTRSKNMQAIRSRGNRSTEVCLRLALVRAGLKGWTVRPAGILGSPDFGFLTQKVAIFADGCFWHGCPRCGHAPITSNASFWVEKVARNKMRDRRISAKLRRTGWHVLRFWEHELRSPQGVVERIIRVVNRCA